MPGSWLRHPPVTVGPRVCPSGQPRFASEWLASAAALGHVCAAGLDPACCRLCRGWHLRPPP